MNVWKWEMDMCCSMHIESLYKLLKEYKEKGVLTGIAVSPKFPAAPHDETLFDWCPLSVGVQKLPAVSVVATALNGSTSTLAFPSCTVRVTPAEQASSAKTHRTEESGAKRSGGAAKRTRLS